MSEEGRNWWSDTNLSGQPAAYYSMAWALGHGLSLIRCTPRRELKAGGWTPCHSPPLKRKRPSNLASGTSAMCRYCCKRILRAAARNFDSPERLAAHLRFVAPATLILLLPWMASCGFCNNICQEETSRQYAGLCFATCVFDTPMRRLLLGGSYSIRSEDPSSPRAP